MTLTFNIFSRQNSSLLSRGRFCSYNFTEIQARGKRELGCTVNGGRGSRNLGWPLPLAQSAQLAASGFPEPTQNLACPLHWGFSFLGTPLALDTSEQPFLIVKAVLSSCQKHTLIDDEGRGARKFVNTDKTGYPIAVHTHHWYSHVVKT